MNYPSISIIIPVYNGEKHLNRCLDSIIAQSYTNFECLLIDDGSTDSSYKILTEYAARDSRFKVFHKENGGVSSARNLGLENIRGQWVAFCDCDDYTDPYWLANFNIEKCHGIDLICQGFKSDKLLYDYISIDCAKQNIYSCEFEGSPSLYIDKMQRSYQIGFLWINLFRSRIINGRSIRFNEQLSHAEDYEFIFHFLCFCGKTRAINKIGYFYHVPDWNSKYSKDTDFGLKTSSLLYNYTKDITKRDETGLTILHHYREDLISKYIALFIHQKNRRREALKKLRSIILDDFWKSQMFFLTKFFIVIDFTYYLSHIILLCHLSLKYKKWI